MNKKKLKIICIIGSIGLMYLVFAIVTGWGIPCPVRLASGGHLQCPGCGISRVFKSIAKLKFGQAVYWNAMIVCLMPFWLVSIGLWLFDKGERFIRIVTWGSIILLLIFGIIRNTPVWPLN